MRGIETLLITALVSSMVMAALSLGLPAPAPAQVVKAGIVTTLRGTATVARGTADQAPLRFRDDVYVEDRITTGDESLARILLGGKAVVTVRERSQLKITTPVDGLASRLAVPSVVEPSRKVTEPVGTPAPAPSAKTWAVRSTS